MSSKFFAKTAVISGAAGGIGLALAQAFGSVGMNIVLADIDKLQLRQAKDLLEEANIPVLACELDVTDYDQWQVTIAAAQERFGEIHMLVNNAGVGGIPGSIEDTNHQTWRWVLDVNLMGVLYGAQAAIPALKKHGQGGWIINVASMAGMLGMPYAGAYCASKAAVVSMTESWAKELEPYQIQVSALCPAFVKTRIHQSGRNRQQQYQVGGAQSTNTAKAQAGASKAAALVESGIEADLLASRVLEALETDQTYIFTHPNYRSVTAARAAAIDSAFVDAQNSPLVRHLQDQDIAKL